MRGASISIRFAWAALFALLLAMRSLAPAGFMPAFDRDGLTIVVCPGADIAVPAMAHHRHSTDHRFSHHPCPYASVSSLGGLGADWVPLLAAVSFAAAVLTAFTPLTLEWHSKRERPPSRGPPIPA